ncbi:MAG: outer membrane beta-barrel protein, partial [Saprospiraceae bacterium]|nr:outer membrane beta-barrel protein [Saprospiraceae bacterium]
NLGNEKIISAYMYIPVKPASWWEMGNNVYANAVEINFESEGQTIRLNTLTYGFNTTNTFKLPKKFTLEISGNFDSPGFWGIAHWQATGSFNVGLEKNMGDKWGKLRFNASDLFLSTNWFGTTDQPEINLLVKQSYQMAERIFMVSWTNSFGNRKLKSARERQTGAAEELRRL